MPHQGRATDSDGAELPPNRERRKQSARTAESRDRLIQAAIRLLGTNGYSRTTLAEIGREAGLSRGLATFHFGSKEQIMLAVVGTISADVADRLEADIGRRRGLDAIDLLVDQYLLGHGDTGRAVRAIYVIIIESVTSSPGLVDAIAANNAALRRKIIGWIAEAYDDGKIISRGDPDSLAVIVEGLLRGVLIQHLADPEAVDLNAVATVTKQLIRDHLRVQDGF